MRFDDVCLWVFAEWSSIFFLTLDGGSDSESAIKYLLSLWRA